MAHFLSEATHQRLELRDAPDELGEEDQYATGVVKTHVFDSAVRAFTVVDNCHSDDAEGLSRYHAAESTPFAAAMQRTLRQGALDVTVGVESTADSMPRLQIWTGDTNGTVTGRIGVTGAPQHVLMQPREKGVFAYALHHHDPYVWVGLSDGFVHIFDANSGARVCEMRAHTAAINAIITVGNYVFTAASDWQILQWDPVELKRVPHGQLSGHQNAVRCLAGTTADSSTSGVLYSGGDDYVVRCWDLDTGYERADPWPIIGHTDSVRAIAVHGVYLFTASSDGQVKAWNTQTAQLVRTLDDRGPNTCIGALAIDAASPALWAGGTDGVIRIWNSQTLVLVGERTDHHATHVALISPVARANAVKAWTLDSNGTLTTLFSDPDGACSTTGTGGYKALQPLEQELQRQVDTNRVKILQNYQELERCRDEFDRLQATERENKTKYAAAVARNRSKLLTITAQKQAAMFLEKRRALATATKRAAAFAARSDVCRLRERFHDWVRIVMRNADTRKQAAVLKQVTNCRKRALVARYASVLADHERNVKASALRNVIATVFAKQNSFLLARVYFARWHRGARARRLAKQQAPFVRAAQKLSSAALTSAYWTKLRNAVVADRAASALRSTIALTQDDGTNRLLRAYWTKWAQLKPSRRDECTKSTSVVVLGDVSERETALAYFGRWQTVAKRRQQEAVRARLDAEEAELAEIKHAVVASEGVNENALESELAAKQRELTQLRQQEQVWDARLRRAAERKRAAQREALRCVSIDSKEPLGTQLATAIYLLKARGVNLKHNEEDILLARQAVSEAGTAAVFAEGLGMVRKVCAAAVRPVPLTDPGDLCWFPGRLFEKLNERQVLKTSQGLSRMVTAFDMANVKQLGQQWLTVLADGSEKWTLPQFGEAIENLGTLLELALRAYRIRRGEDMLTGGPKSEHRVRARSRSKSKPRSGSKGTKTKRRAKSRPKPAQDSPNADSKPTPA
mmetsp:Transcript_36701/g.113126  ORF Transcript_36701/g.113126 Transcript_36701/m.113126 type:complete len:975 (-) Transcript_36701:34-2958(-)